MDKARKLMLVAAALWFRTLACAPEGDNGIDSRRAGIINSTLVTTDPAGYAWTLNGLQVQGSGMFLSPQWVLTSGHFMANNDNIPRSSFNNPPTVSAEIGTTFNGQQGTGYVHPNWWGDLTVNPPVVGPKDPGYDVALIRFLTPFDTSNYPANKLYNQLSNDWTGAQVRCFAYGAQSLDGSGGGQSVLQTAAFDVTGMENTPFLPITDPSTPASSVPLYTVADGTDNGGGQRLFHGDSGGTCRTEGRSPYVIGGIVQSFVQHADGTHTTYLVDPWNVKYWVDQTMHSPLETIPTSAPGTPVAFTSASTKTGLNRRNYVVATLSGTVPYLNQNRASGWSGWNPLPAIPPDPPILGTTHGNVGLTVSLDSGSEPHLWMAVASKGPSSRFIPNPQIMWVSGNYVPGTNPPWPTFTWTNAGSPPANRLFRGNPAIVTPGALATDRVDYFAYASDTTFDAFGLIYTRWMYNGAWQDAGWTALPSIPGVNIKSSPSVALRGNTYYVAARGSDDQIWITTLPNVSNSGSYGGPWTDWFPMAGLYLGSPAITAWERGLDVYGIGYDNRLWHQTMDADGVWSDLIQLNATFTSATALTASNLLPSIHEINIVGMNAGSPASPRITRYAW